MNKKYLFALALPMALASCSQEEGLVTENVSTPNAKVVEGVSFNLAKADAGLESRALWSDTDKKVSFEAEDMVSLYWIDKDGLETSLWGSATSLGTDDALKAQSNAIFRTTDGSKFESEAVVYEGYNMLVFPANTSHTTNKEIEVTIPSKQKATDDFASNIVYVGDSILQIHQPQKYTDNKWRNMYREEATSTDPNTSGYAHGIKTGVKMLTSVLKLQFDVINTTANDVKVQKVVLTTAGGTDKIFTTKGNLVAGNINDAQKALDVNSLTKHNNPWFKAVEAGKVAAMELDCTEMTGNTATLLLNPAAYTALTGTSQPVLKVYTNYGIVTIGGQGSATTQSRCIYKTINQVAAETDNQALQDIVANTQYANAARKIQATSTNKFEYTVNSGVYMSRIVKVDMTKAVYEEVSVSSTEELNKALTVAQWRQSNGVQNYTAANPFTVKLNYNHAGEFELSSYAGIEAFKGVVEFEEGTCTSTATGHATALNTIKVNTKGTETVLKNLNVGTSIAATYTIPATSAITTVKNGTSTADFVLNLPLVNKKTITVPALAQVEMANNKDAEIVYVQGAEIDVTALTNTTYGVISLANATSYSQINSALVGGANKITVKNLIPGFFNGTLNGLEDANGTAYPAHAQGANVTFIFDNCGNLNEAITNGVVANTVVLKNGTNYPNVKNSAITTIEVEGDATIGFYNGSNDKVATNIISNIIVKEGNVDMNNLITNKIEVKAGATATIGKYSYAPKYFNVYGEVTFNGKNGQGSGTTAEKVFLDTNNNGKIDTIKEINGTCIVTGTLNMSNDVAYSTVKVNANTKINVTGTAKGLGYDGKIYVTVNTQAKNTANLIYLQEELTGNGNDIYSTAFSW